MAVIYAGDMMEVCMLEKWRPVAVVLLEGHESCFKAGLTVST